MFYNIATFVFAFIPPAWNFSFMVIRCLFHARGIIVSSEWN
ncbi:hypothetical protein PRABACTJOHN_01175 [Parabacteroides johnsonii DSM 18315]|uniref:Uncharacterized protein n=1 Tax=Parabacteroides johnsonii DSM 18315 TaxID=537006 RepID=B7B825_9BACT|nr:hypothetical protein PRABACTJOHN_01175 [Parabacteroides johnsonii DSM 18315]